MPREAASSRAVNAGSPPEGIVASPCRISADGTSPEAWTERERPSGSQTSTAVISFRVRVPVLSVQMTVVNPSDSTAASRRTSAPRLAMRCIPTARATVVATGKPSGTVGRAG